MLGMSLTSAPSFPQVMLTGIQKGEVSPSYHFSEEGGTQHCLS